MRFLNVVSLFLLLGAIDEAVSRPKTIKAWRNGVRVWPKAELLATDFPIENGQPISWFKSFGNNTLYMSGEVSSYLQGEYKNVIAKFNWSEKIDICGMSRDGTWVDVTRELVQKSWLPTGACPVKAGNYTLTEPTKFETNFNEKVVSNTYIIKVFVGYSALEKAFLTEYLAYIDFD